MKRAREARSELSDQRRHQCGTLLKRALCHSTADVERAPSASEFGTRPRPTVPGQAIQLLETTRPYEGYALFQIAYLRGQAYLKQQKGAEAASEFQKILDHRGYQTTSPIYVVAHLGLARAAALQRRPGKSAQGLSGFLRAVERRGSGHPHSSRGQTRVREVEMKDSPLSSSGMVVAG